jgi:hypothetical protein
VPGEAQALGIDAFDVRIERGDRGRIGAGAGEVVGVGLHAAGTEKVDRIDQSVPEHGRVQIAALLTARRLLVGATLAARIEAHDHIAGAHQCLRGPPVQGLRRLDRAVLDDHGRQIRPSIARRPDAT